MKRLVSYSYNDPIAFALASMPAGIRSRVENTDYFCGASPVFAGLHNYVDTDDGRPYSRTAHAVWIMHQWLLPRTLRVPTVVLPQPVGPKTVVHELGHILHEALEFKPDALAVTEYGKTNRWEAFAEAFTAWLGWYGPDVRGAVDERTATLFAALS